MICKYFLLGRDLSFHVLNAVFWTANVFNFNEVQLIKNCFLLWSMPLVTSDSFYYSLQGRNWGPWWKTVTAFLFVWGRWGTDLSWLFYRSTQRKWTWCLDEQDFCSLPLPSSPLQMCSTMCLGRVLWGDLEMMEKSHSLTVPLSTWKGKTSHGNFRHRGILRPCMRDFSRRSDLVIMLEGEWFEAEALVFLFFKI